MFEDVVTDQRCDDQEAGLSKKAGEALMHIAHESVKIPKVEVTGQLVLMSAEPDGVMVIRNALKKASEAKTAGADIESLYLGAPIYRIKVTASDYKKAEKALEKAANAAVSVLEKAGGEGKLIKKPKSGKSQ